VRPRGGGVRTLLEIWGLLHRSGKKLTINQLRYGWGVNQELQGREDPSFLELRWGENPGENYLIRGRDRAEKKTTLLLRENPPY